MTERIKKSWRELAGVAAIAVAGAVLGLSAVPSTAKAQNEGYTCQGTNLCHQGTSRCCTNNYGGSGLCSTYCPIKA